MLTRAHAFARAGVVIEELDDAPPAAAPKAGKPAADAHKDRDFIPLGGDAAGKKRAAAQQPAAQAPAAKKQAPAAAAPPQAAKPGSQFTDGPPGTLGSRKFDNGLEIINLANGKPDAKVALPGKRCVMRVWRNSALRLCRCDWLTGCAL